MTQLEATCAMCGGTGIIGNGPTSFNKQICSCQNKITMTEAERIRKEATKFATFETAPNEMEKYNELYSGYIAGAKAENERLQQQLKEKEEITNNFIQINKDAAIIIKDLRSLNETTEAELKSAQELNRELLCLLIDIKGDLEKEGYTTIPERIESLINKAK